MGQRAESARQALVEIERPPKSTHEIVRQPGNLVLV